MEVAMNNLFQKFTMAFMAIFLFAEIGCTQTEPSQSATTTPPPTSRRLTVGNWNVETFFDSVTTGQEYTEFVKSKTWGTEAYIERLKRLCSVIKTLDADIFVMEEIENEGVLQDISNFLAGEWNSKKLYSYSCFAKDEGSSIGCGVLSRFPLAGMTIHALDVRSEADAMPRMRPLMQVQVEYNGGQLQLLVNHWKSKSGGEEKTAPWRLWQESVLGTVVRRITMEQQAVLACGDFNQDLLEFERTNSVDGIKLRSRHGQNNAGIASMEVEVHSPWFSAGGLIKPGSYYYNDEWSRIDHFFAAGKAQIESFAPQTNGPWCDTSTKVPKRYEIWSGWGYSDHLPIKCVVAF